MPRAQFDDITIHYQQSGQGADVVLLHGFTSNLAMWMFSKIIVELAGEYRVTCLDLRGHGLSSAPSEGYTSAHMAGDLKQLHAHLELQPALILGHSFGGVVAMHAARLYPEIVRGVILSDTYFPGLSHLEPHMEHAEVWQNLRESMLAVGADIGAKVDFRRLFDALGPLTERQINILIDKMGAPAVRWLDQLKPLTQTTAAEEVFQPAGFGEEEIAQVKQPVVALYDERTPFAATCRFLAEHLDDVETDSVPGASHLALLESPEEFVRRVKLHLRRMDQRDVPAGGEATRLTTSANTTGTSADTRGGENP
jgi:pimeloyl-ACP methyl ester carboxylesterase